MSTRIDTGKVRAAWPVTDATQRGSAVDVIDRLCVEIDALRDALRETMLDAVIVLAGLDELRAARSAEAAEPTGGEQ